MFILSCINLNYVEITLQRPQISIAVFCFKGLDIHISESRVVDQHQATSLVRSFYMSSFWDRQFSEAGFFLMVLAKAHHDQPNHESMLLVSVHLISAHITLAKASHMVETRSIRE